MQAPQMPVWQGQYVRIEGIAQRTPADASWNTPLYIEAQTYSVVD
jgi:hypothetical protein